MKSNHLSLYIASAVQLLLLVGLTHRAPAQGTGVPVYSEPATAEPKLLAAAEKLHEAGKLLSQASLTDQLTRKSCEVKLPTARTTRLSSRELWSTSRAAHLRVGWYYLCPSCENRHFEFGAGYPVTADGVVATVYHLMTPPKSFRDPFLIVVDEDGNVFAVTEFLAGNPSLDACLLRVAGAKFKPLPLQTNVFPGDLAVCFSDPLHQRGYFSDGIVNRFLTRSDRGAANDPTAKDASAEKALRLNVTTDWAPGSSGAAILDGCGNAIGHVAGISPMGEPVHGKDGAQTQGPTLITIHEAVSAKDVLSLVRKQAK